jgi:HEAT repeat protein
LAYIEGSKTGAFNMFIDLFKAYRFAGKDDVEGLIKILKDSKDKFARWEAAEALGEIGDKRAVDPLIEALNDKKPLIRWKAAEALGEIKDKRAVDPLIEALKGEDEDWCVRKTAAEALGKIGDKRAVEPLIEALKDEDRYVRETARKVLEKIKGF